MKTVALFFITAVIFILLDMVWLGYLGKAIYLEKIGTLLRLEGTNINANIKAAIIVYIALISGIVFLVFPLAQGSIYKALIYGAFFGFVTYATYDFTNLAVLKGWRWDIALIDTLWGITLCGVSSSGALAIYSFFFKP